MGGPMGGRLIDAGHEVVAFDLSSEAQDQARRRGAQVAATCRAVAAASDVLITMLPHGPAVLAAADGPDGLVAGLRPGTLWMEMTSSSPALTARLARDVTPIPVDFLDAPVTGGVPKAVSGELTVMVAGSDEAIDRARPLLDVLAGRTFRVGDRAGLGDVAKTVNNLLSAANLALAAEGLALATRCGVPTEAMLDVLNAGTGQSNATTWKIPEYVITGRFDSGFTMGQYLKDLGIAISVADDEHLPLPLARQVADVWAELTAQAGESADHTEVVRAVAATSDVDLTT